MPAFPPPGRGTVTPNSPFCTLDVYFHALLSQSKEIME
jgi:hypothetical protein